MAKRYEIFKKSLLDAGTKNIAITSSLILARRRRARPRSLVGARCTLEVPEVFVQVLLGRRGVDTPGRLDIALDEEVEVVGVEKPTASPRLLGSVSVELVTAVVADSCGVVSDPDLSQTTAVLASLSCHRSSRPPRSSRLVFATSPLSVYNFDLSKLSEDRGLFGLDPHELAPKSSPNVCDHSTTTFRKVLLYEL